MISYYDLICMVKEGNAPGTIEVKLCSEKAKTYIAEYDGRDFNYYHLEFEDLEDDNYHYYLSECFIESTMFDKCITILDEEDEFIDIEEITPPFTPISQELKGELSGVVAIYNSIIYELKDNINDLIKNQKKIINKLKEEGK